VRCEPRSRCDGVSINVFESKQRLTMVEDRARQLAGAGAHIALHYASLEGQNESRISREEVARSGVRVSVHVGDLTSDAAIDRLVEDVCKAHGNSTSAVQSRPFCIMLTHS